MRLSIATQCVILVAGVSGAAIHKPRDEGTRAQAVKDAFTFAVGVHATFGEICMINIL